MPRKTKKGAAHQEGVDLEDIKLIEEVESGGRTISKITLPSTEQIVKRKIATLYYLSLLSAGNVSKEDLTVIDCISDATISDTKDGLGKEISFGSEAASGSSAVVFLEIAGRLSSKFSSKKDFVATKITKTSLKVSNIKSLADSVVCVAAEELPVSVDRRVMGALLTVCVRNSIDTSTDKLMDKICAGIAKGNELAKQEMVREFEELLRSNDNNKAITDGIAKSGCLEWVSNVLDRGVAIIIPEDQVRIKHFLDAELEKKQIPGFRRAFYQVGVDGSSEQIDGLIAEAVDAANERKKSILAKVEAGKIAKNLVNEIVRGAFDSLAQQGVDASKQIIDNLVTEALTRFPNEIYVQTEAEQTRVAVDAGSQISTETKGRGVATEPTNTGDAGSQTAPIRGASVATSTALPIVADAGTMFESAVKADFAAQTDPVLMETKTQKDHEHEIAVLIAEIVVNEVLGRVDFQISEVEKQELLQKLEAEKQALLQQIEIASRAFTNAYNAGAKAAGQEACDEGLKDGKSVAELMAFRAYLQGQKVMTCQVASFVGPAAGLFMPHVVQVDHGLVEGGGLAGTAAELGMSFSSESPPQTYDNPSTLPSSAPQRGDRGGHSLQEGSYANGNRGGGRRGRR